MHFDEPYVSTSLPPGNRQGLGPSLGLTYDTAEEDGFGGAEWRLTPSYRLFFSDIERRGPVVAVGPQLLLRDGGQTAGEVRWGR